jgi:hypothetical protein
MKFLTQEGRAMTREVSCQSFTSKSRFESQDILCGICNEQSGIRRNSTQVRVGRLSSHSIISLIFQSPFIHPLIDWFINSFTQSCVYPLTPYNCSSKERSYIINVKNLQKLFLTELWTYFRVELLSSTSTDLSGILLLLCSIL